MSELSSYTASAVAAASKPESDFLPDLTRLREGARKRIDEGAMTPDYGLDREKAVSKLNAALATELVCVLRYRQHHFVASGINSEPIAREFLVHSNDEQGHADQIAQRISQLGGTPTSLRTRFPAAATPNTLPAIRWTA